MQNLAPIVLFVYNRPWHTQQTLEALQKNELADKSELFIYADGEKTANDPQVAEVRKYIKTIKGFKNVTIIEREKNWGLADNIIDGVTTIVNKYGKIIVLEDDIVTSRFFLHFMNDGLNLYKDESNVYGITGYSYFPDSNLPDTFLLPIGSSWSWATWKDKWAVFEEDAEKLVNEITEKKLIGKFDFGNYPFWKMLNSQVEKKVNSWAIRFYASFFLKEGLFIFPKISLVSNTGFDNSGTHCGTNSTFGNDLNHSNLSLVKVKYHKKHKKNVEKNFRKHYMVPKQTRMKRLKTKFKNIAKKIISFDIINSKLQQLNSNYNTLTRQQTELKILTAKNLLENKLNNPNNKKIQDFEFKVFSQWGDDGIIQYLINTIEIKNKYFIEFGVENYLESNTRFLLINNNWSGLVMDGDKKNVDFIKKDEIYWRHDITAKHAFVTAENINKLIKEDGIDNEIGLLHIDIDGNDYWIWNAINVIKPQIVIVEYNSIFGNKRAITIPYKADFVRTKEHYSNLYAGTSLKALTILAEKKGYDLVGCNSAGNNAYFVDKKYSNELNTLSVEEAYVESKFKEARDVNGNLTYIRGEKRLEKIKGLDVFNTETNQLEKV